MKKLSQKIRLYQLLSDGKPHRTDEILEKVYGASHLGVARIASRIHDLRKQENLDIISYREPQKPSLWVYQLIIDDDFRRIENQVSV